MGNFLSKKEASSLGPKMTPLRRMTFSGFERISCGSRTNQYSMGGYEEIDREPKEERKEESPYRLSKNLQISELKQDEPFDISKLIEAQNRTQTLLSSVERMIRKQTSLINKIVKHRSTKSEPVVKLSDSEVELKLSPVRTRKIGKKWRRNPKISDKKEESSPQREPFIQNLSASRVL